MTHHHRQTHLRAAELLAAAADRIERCGLFQGEYWPISAGRHTTYVDGDPCCALGALAVAAEFDDAPLADVALDTRPELILAIDALTEHIDSPSGGQPAQVPAWNDRPGRTHIKVGSALRAAAAQLRVQAPDPPAGPTSDLAGGPSAASVHRAGSSSIDQHSAGEVTTNV
jgi:hypothetical protein